MSDPTASRTHDVELARRCVRGDREAQRAFFHAHRRRVHHVLFRTVGSNRDMDDLVQDAFVEILRALPGFRGDARLATWIDRICVRVGHRYIADRMRDRARAPMLELLAPDPDAAPDRRAEAREATRRLYALLDAVPFAHRMAYVLHVVDGRPLRDVAEVMEASVIATKLRVWRTRRRVEAAAAADPVLSAFVDGAGGEGT